MKVNVLGTVYNVKLDISKRDNKFLDELDGYTDDSSKIIVVSDCEDTTYDNPQDYKNRVLLHEIVHSFLNECGLPECTCEWHCEEMVEWCATMVPKIMEAYNEVTSTTK